MIINAVRDKLAALSLDGETVPAYDTHAGSDTPPYWVVWGTPDDRPGDDSCVASAVDYSVDFAVTCTASMPDTARLMAAMAIDALTPGRVPALLAVPGLWVEVEYLRVDRVRTDTSWKVAGTDTHPSYAVALFRAHVQPVNIPEESL